MLLNLLRHSQPVIGNSDDRTFAQYFRANCNFQGTLVFFPGIFQSVVDPIVFPPRILMLVGEQNSKCCIYYSSANYKLLFLSSSYGKAHSWLGEDEYERVDGRLLATEIV